MELFWYVAAALAAGVGTGLAGLSAATVMVPVLIVLCPSFAGETGAYHATAIALASDILGSAFTAAIYIKHRNIDLKRGGLMFACIVSMCVAGSIAAWHAGNVVLGTFSLFLCVGIGIRFLLKPDTQKKQTVSRGAKLDWKAVAISLFFGLTIGFGTGFVGSGGGMMMLVVFTAFLGMERKSAVGTSTLIMTFTALIAFVSHAMVDPAIVLERWDVLLICMATETAASVISARFANRVDNRIVGLVTGAVLTVLGVVLLGMHYADVLAAWALPGKVAACIGKYLIYLAACIALLLLARAVLPISAELWRKMLHFVAYTSSLCMMAVSRDWLTAAVCCALFAVAVYPLLALAERWQGYGAMFSQRKEGEIKNSLLLLFFTHAALIAVCWGLLKKPFIAVTAILMWGTGDTMAALVGKRYGRHHIHLPHADTKKTWEGTAAMAATAFAVGLASLVITSPYGWPVCLLLAMLCAPVAAYVELISHGGHDTATVACAVAAVLSLVTGCMSLLDSYDASDAALAAIAAGNVQEQVVVFEPEGKAKAGLIFYPGGLVEHEAYAPLLQACAERGILCLLPQMPLDLAVLNMNAADGLQEHYPQIEDWMIGGHSLGGAMAASYVDKHTQDYDGLVLLGAYSTADLTDTTLRVLSVVGTQDGVINREKYEECRENYPSDFTEMILEGGCHAYFGDYGQQAGDGVPTITREQQMNATADAIAALLEE